MNEVHRIRLRGPWEATPLDASAPGFESIRMRCPCTWREGGWPNYHGRALHVRRFGKPRSNEFGERVDLVFDPCNGDCVVRLNGAALCSFHRGAAISINVTDLLRERNQLTIEVQGEDDTCGLTGEVRLEISAKPSAT